MNYNVSLTENREYEKMIVRRMNAFLMAIEEGFDSACLMYPQDADFLIENQYKTYEKVRKELARSLERV